MKFLLRSLFPLQIKYECMFRVGEVSTKVVQQECYGKTGSAALLEIVEENTLINRLILWRCPVGCVTGD